MSEVENRIPEVPEEARTKVRPATHTPGGTESIHQARKLAGGPDKCEWCGEIKPGMRRTGPRICRECWKAYMAEEAERKARQVREAREGR